MNSEKHGRADTFKRLPSIFVVSFDFDHCLYREDESLKSNFFLVLDHDNDLVNFALGSVQSFTRDRNSPKLISHRRARPQQLSQLPRYIR